MPGSKADGVGKNFQMAAWAIPYSLYDQLRTVSTELVAAGYGGAA